MAARLSEVNAVNMNKNTSSDDVMLEKGLLDSQEPEPASTWLEQVKERYEDFISPSAWFSGHRPKKPLHRTAYLDGLRGFAALLVYVLHHQVWGHAGIGGEFILENAYGWDKQFYFICIPGIRVLFSGGHLAVAVFFVISGYVLSAKPMSLIQAGETTQVADNLGSALFRRWARLYLPVIATTFVWMTSWHLFGLRSLSPGAYEPEKKYIDEVWKWYSEIKNYSFVFHEDPAFGYNDHTWSIALEFKGSIVIYTCLMAFARLSRNARLCCEAGLVFYFLYIVDGWFCSLFAMGMLLCDLDLLAIRNELPSFFKQLEPFKDAIYYTLLCIALYLGGVPSITGDLDHLRKSPGWYYLSFLKPQAVFDPRWFYRFWAATFIVAAVPRIKSLKAFFETNFCQYLGRVSFGLYLVHGPVLWSLGDRVYAATGRIRDAHAELVPAWINLCPFPSWGPFGLEVNFIMAHVVLLPVTLWLAEIVTKVIDGPTVNFAQWMYKRARGVSEKPNWGFKSGVWGKN
ncbi:hypothetical protein A1O1_07945 [Capronia coronata CBS 617.96]|uniref:Acyltransferase 3 domain-containing protein n=1 Tax=Capronia coronata CBS 617.96 TaxID=1182541 RepID=W9XX17_9EURO|nr:uncharacterized protein A1O1_07945 [Capronia coronata CBS 617.96]EXJ81880.1 hypothetical protein A1O1_07945 [Capronia coronata CBS 617.96]